MGFPPTSNLTIQLLAKIYKCLGIMYYMINIIKKCPNCGSTRIKGGIEVENGVYVQKVVCLRCRYHNRRVLQK